jgi:hypothetical protein
MDRLARTTIATTTPRSVTTIKNTGNACDAIHFSVYVRLIVHCGAAMSMDAVDMLATSNSIKTEAGQGKLNA